MGRIVELCGVIAESAEEGPEGLRLPPADWEHLSQDFTDEEIEDALTLVNESLYQGELVEAADSLSARLLELLGSFSEEAAFARAASGEARLPIDAIGQLARRVARLEELLDFFRDQPPPDRRGFEALRRRLADLGIESEMRKEPSLDAGEPGPDEDDDE
jgi:hypothetical protein